MAKALDYIMGTANLIGGDNSGTGGTGKSTTVSPAATPVAGETNNEAGKNTTNTQQSGNVAQPSTQSVTDTTNPNGGIVTEEEFNYLQSPGGRRAQASLLGGGVDAFHNIGRQNTMGINAPHETPNANTINEPFGDDQMTFTADQLGLNDDEKKSPVTGTSGITPDMWEDDEETKEWQEERDLAYRDIIAAINKRAEGMKPPETEDQRKKRERKEKWRRFAAGFGDVAAALLNLRFTTQGAPNAYTGEGTLSMKNLEREQRLRKEREEDADNYLKVRMQKYATIGDAIKQRRTEKKERLTLMMQAQKAEQEARIAEARAKVLAAQGNHYAAQVELEKARALNEEADTAKKKAETRRANEQADMVRPLAQSTMAKNAAQAGAANASRVNSLESAAEHRAKANNERSGKGSSSKYYGSLLGQDYQTQADYEAALYGAAQDYGVNTDEIVKSTDKFGDEKTTRWKRPNGAIRAEIEKKAKAKKKDYSKLGKK